jgi:hypothetical protein
MAELPELFVDVLDRADRTLVAGWYDAVSVSAERVRAWLRSRGLPFLDPAVPVEATLDQVDQTAEALVARSAALVGAMGGAAGLVGAATVPTEWLAANVAALRLAQRLCVVYGFDPATDRGQMALCRALAHAYGVELPETGALRMRLSDVPSLFRRDRPPSEVSARLVRGMAKSSAWWVAGRISRFVPVLSASRHAWDARKQVRDAGAKMQDVLRRLAEAPETGIPEDALEV